MTSIIKRGDIFFADLSPVVGSEQGGFRPVIIIQNDVGNKYLPTVIIAPLTSRISHAKLPTHVPISNLDSTLPKDCVILLEQVKSIDKHRLREKISNVSNEILQKVDKSLILATLGDKAFDITSHINLNTNTITDENQYKTFSEQIKNQSESINQLHDFIVKSNSFGGKFKDWIFGGIIGAIIAIIIPLFI